MFRRNAQREVEQSLRRWGESEVEQLAARLGLPRRSVEEALSQLRRRGTALRGPGRPSVWRVAAV